MTDEDESLRSKILKLVGQFLGWLVAPLIREEEDRAFRKRVRQKRKLFALAARYRELGQPDLAKECVAKAERLDRENPVCLIFGQPGLPTQAPKSPESQSQIPPENGSMRPTAPPPSQAGMAEDLKEGTLVEVSSKPEASKKSSSEAKPTAPPKRRGRPPKNKPNASESMGESK